MINIDPSTKPVKHGGNLSMAVQQYAIDRSDWLDMSTGISPWSWPIGPLPDDVWRALPPPLSELLNAAASYYGCDTSSIIATPGSQIAIRLIPQMFMPSTVAVPTLGYQEHALSWRIAGHDIVSYENHNELLKLASSGGVEHAVIINPNNPTAEKFTQTSIEQIASTISGTLIIDEAFIDLYADTQHAILSSAVKKARKNQIVLRSIGKFFGLAGLRLGFAIGKHPKLSDLDTLLQPWPLSHASQIIATQALQDSAWQQQQRLRINSCSKRFIAVLESFLQSLKIEYHLVTVGLFTTVFGKRNELQKLHQQLAANAIWTRLHNPGDSPAWLRFSLPNDIDCLASALQKINHQNITQR